MTRLFVNELGGWYRLEHDRCVGGFDVSPEMLGPDGCVRPSIVATEADMVGGALATQASEPRVPLTVDLTVHRIEPFGTGHLSMAGRVLKAGRRTTVTEILISAGDERPLFVSHATFMPAPRPEDIQPFSGDRTMGAPSLTQPFVEQLGVRVIAPGTAELDRTPYTMQPTGTVQGGAVAAVAEVAAETLTGRAVADLELRYLSAVRVGPARATAEPVGRDRVRVEVRDPGNDGRLATLVLATVR
jgi:acyl-coenzyme A thioesterase PaaI-like protein